MTLAARSLSSRLRSLSSSPESLSTTRCGSAMGSCAPFMPWRGPSASTSPAADGAGAGACAQPATNARTRTIRMARVYSRAMRLLTRDLPGTGGLHKASPEDFIVDELPAYAPAGDGAHTFVRIEKRALTPAEAVARLCRVLGVSPKDAGVAGQKDRQ